MSNKYMCSASEAAEQVGECCNGSCRECMSWPLGVAGDSGAEAIDIDLVPCTFSPGLSSTSGQHAHMHQVRHYAGRLLLYI